MVTTERTTRQNEKEVARLLNKFDNTDFKLSTKKYSSFDVYGTFNKEYTLVEVKKRRQWWSEMFIEVDKIKRLAEDYRKVVDHYDTCNVLLVCSVGDEHLAWNVKDITSFARIETRSMNAQTSNGWNKQGKKIEKEVYVFKKDSYMLDLTNTSLNTDRYVA